VRNTRNRLQTHRFGVKLKIGFSFGLRGGVGGHWATMRAQMTESQGDMTLHSGTGSRSPFEFVLDAR
jgi:hypothetical protein